MEICHLNAYSVVGPCFSAKFLEKQTQISLKPEKTSFPWKKFVEFYFIHGAGILTKELLFYMTM